ncbi:YybH family protein [Jatrophihabitans sp. YIM 134969]
MTSSSDTASTDTSTDTDETAIRAVVDTRVAAMERGDAAAIVAQYAPGAVVFSLAPPLVQPADGARDVEALQEWFDGKGGRVGSGVRDVQVTVGGDVAFVTALERMADPAGAGFELWFRTTLGLRRVDGTWLVTHEHTSVPFLMDGSFRAATDLRP